MQKPQHIALQIIHNNDNIICVNDIASCYWRPARYDTIR